MRFEISTVQFKEYAHWQLSQSDAIASLTLAREAVSNSLNGEVLAELRQIASIDFRGAGIRALILNGSGRHFSVGMDLSVIEDLAQLGPDEFRRRVADMQSAFDAFDELNIAVVCAIRGFCIGGGLLLAACADVRIASERAIFSMPEVRMGFGISLGMHRLLRMVTQAAASEMVLLGERFSAERARELGVLTQVTPDGKLDEQANRLAQRLAALPPEGVRLNKQILRAAALLPPEESQRLEAELQVAGLGNDALLEPMRAYAKRAGRSGQG